MKDYLSKDSTILKNKKLFLLDMDGTIYNDETIFDGTLKLLNYIQKIGGRYIFVSNNSSKSITDYVKKVTKMGISATEKDFYISTQASAQYIKDNFQNALVYASGTKSFIEGLKSFGINVTANIDDNINVILMGYDTELTYEKLTNLVKLINKGIPYLATNPDLVCPTSFGYAPDCGSVAIMLKNATGKSPIYIGKPEPTMILSAIKQSGFTKEETVVIGDRMYTDIASGLNAGVTTILVLSGEATLEDYKNENKNIPTFVYKDVRELIDQLDD